MDVITPTEFTVKYTDEVPVRCRVCRDAGRQSGTFTVLRREVWPEDAPPAEEWEWRIDGLANPHIFPTFTMKPCNNTGCKNQPRLKQSELRSLYERAVSKRLGTIFI